MMLAKSGSFWGHGLLCAVRPVETVDNSQVSTCIDGDTNGNKALMNLSLKEKKQHTQSAAPQTCTNVGAQLVATADHLSPPRAFALASHHPAPRAISHRSAPRAALNHILTTWARRAPSLTSHHPAPRGRRLSATSALDAPS
eukprot:6175203-Pleurochrysis_carterae.AAC.2